MEITIEHIANQLTYKYKMGQSLKRIYDDLLSVFGVADAPWYFSAFIDKNRNESGFMTEFNSTSFVENVNCNFNKGE